MISILSIMGKREKMAQIPLDELRHLDHPVFGSLQIVRQSPELKGSLVSTEKTAPENRKIEKTKSDNSMVVNHQTPKDILQRSDSLNSHLSKYSIDRVYNSIYLNGASSSHKTEDNGLKPWNSAELPSIHQRNNLGNGHNGTTNGGSNLNRITNGERTLCRSLSNNSSVSASDSDDLLNCVRSIKNTSNFFRSMSSSRGSSIEEESGDGAEGRRHVSNLVDELLLDIYGKWYCSGMGLSFQKRRHSSSAQESDCCSTSGGTTMPWKIQQYLPSQGINDVQQRSRLNNKCKFKIT